MKHRKDYLSPHSVVYPLYASQSVMLTGSDQQNPGFGTRAKDFKEEFPETEGGEEEYTFFQ